MKNPIYLCIASFCMWFQKIVTHDEKLYKIYKKAEKMGHHKFCNQVFNVAKTMVILNGKIKGKLIPKKIMYTVMDFL